MFKISLQKLCGGGGGLRRDCIVHHTTTEPHLNEPLLTEEASSLQ